MPVRAAGRGGDLSPAAGRHAVPDAGLPHLPEDEELAAGYRSAHQAYLDRRRELGDVPEIDGVSAGGMPTRVKCLHALLGHALAAGPGVNPLGDEVRDAVSPWWSGGPCVRVEETG